MALEKAMDKEGLNYIPTVEYMINYRDKNKKLLYYKEDGHWTNEVNYILAGKIADKIKELSNE